MRQKTKNSVIKMKNRKSKGSETKKKKRDQKMECFYQRLKVNRWLTRRNSQCLKTNRSINWAQTNHCYSTNSFESLSVVYILPMKMTRLCSVSWSGPLFSSIKAYPWNLGLMLDVWQCCIFNISIIRDIVNFIS